MLIHILFLCGGSGGQAEYGDRGKEALHDAEELVVRTKVVAPLAAAVHLVDRQAGEDPGLVACLQLAHEPLALGQLIGRDVQQH